MHVHVVMSDRLKVDTWSSANILPFSPISFSELPECQMKIAMNQDVLFQLTCLSLTPSVHIMFPQHVAMVFVSVAYTPSAHEHIAQSVIIHRLLEACKRRALGQKDDQIEILMLWLVHDL